MARLGSPCRWRGSGEGPGSGEWPSLGERPGSGERRSERTSASPPASAASSRAEMPAGQSLDRIGDRVGKMHPVGIRPLGATALNADRMPRVPDHGGVRRHVVDDHAVGADLRTMTDVDWAEQLGSRSDRHVVLNAGMTFAGGEAGAAERDALVQGDVVANLGCLANHHAHAVVDEEAVANPGGGMNFDPGQRTGQRGNGAGQQGDPGAVERVGDPVSEKRVDARPGGEDLERADAGRGRVAALGRGDIAPDLGSRTRDQLERPHGHSVPRRLRARRRAWKRNARRNRAGS